MDLTLSQIMDRLYAVHQSLSLAQQMVTSARDREVAAKEEYRMALARAVLAKDCPRVGRGEDKVTAGERDAHVDLATASERFAAAVAEAATEAARDNLRVTRDQAGIVQSLGALARAEMALGSPGQT